MEGVDGDGGGVRKSDGDCDRFRGGVFVERVLYPGADPRSFKKRRGRGTFWRFSIFLFPEISGEDRLPTVVNPFSL